jgi:hypothetical protein
VFSGNIPMTTVEQPRVNYPTPSDTTRSPSSWGAKTQSHHTPELPQQGITPYHWHGFGDNGIDIGSRNRESEEPADEPRKANTPSVLQDLEATGVEFEPQTDLEWALDQQQ